MPQDKLENPQNNLENPQNNLENPQDKAENSQDKLENPQDKSENPDNNTDKVKTRPWLSILLGLLTGVWFHYVLFRLSLPTEPFIYAAF
jgi:hypothetical protein